MQWFAGNVQTAIQISRKNQALLVVYVTNDSEDVRLFDSFWDQVEPANLICPIVGIKLKDGETAAQQFSDIYPTPILPAAYLINQSGEPLEVITPLVGKEYDQFRAKFNKAVEQFVKTTPKVANSGAAASVVVPTSSQAPAASIPAPQPVSAAPIDPNLAEKVARAKELLKIKKQKEEEQRRIQEKTQKEEMMKAQKTRQEHEDKALMEAAKQRKKEKLEAGKEKERILAQIKADRENAKKKFGKPAENPENSTTEAEKKPSDSVGKSIPSDRCRLQVRLPDGSIFVEEFPSNDVLNSLVEIIRQKPIITGLFEVSQTYPRRVFSLEDYSKSFLDNKLTPSSALVVVLKPSTTAKASSAIVTTSSSVFTLLFSPVLLIWNLLSGWFGGMAASGSAAAAKKSENSTGTGGPQNPGAGRARGMPRVAEVRRRGNVAGLENPNDDDPEERANFNGNSTQFM